MQLNCGYLTTE